MSKQTQGDAAALQRQLRETEHNLAELIDEIVYAEQEASEAGSARKAAQQQLEVATRTLENVLAYTTRLEQDVILPALSDLNSVLTKREELAVARRRGVASLEELPGATVSPRFAQIMERLTAPPPAVAESLQRRQDALSVARQSQNISTDPEDAFVLMEGLITERQQLLALVSDARRQLRSETAGTAGSPGDDTSSSAAGAEGGAVASELRRELADVKALLDKTRGERDSLLKRIDDGSHSAGAFSMLQGQWHTERSSLQKRVRDMEETIEDNRKERASLMAQIDGLREDIDQVKQERALLDSEVHRMRDERLSSVARRDMSSAGFGPGERFGSSEHELRLELDRLTREHSTHVTELQSEIASLRSEAQVSRRERGYSESQTAQIEQLRRNNQQLRADISRLQQQMASSSQRSGVEGSDGALALESKVKSFEMTIAQLNDELGNVDRRIADVEQQHQEEKRKLIASFDSERRQYQLEREECDALVLKMTSELEYLVRENAAIRNGAYSANGSSHVAN